MVAQRRASAVRRVLARARAVPLHAYPRVVTHRLQRRRALRGASSTPRELRDADLAGFFQADDWTDLVARFRTRRAPRFFLADDPQARAALVALHGPQAREQLLRRGADLLAHRFNLLGSGPTYLGKHIPWRRDIISGHEWPREHFSRLRIVDLDAAFDIKLPWELSRFHHVPTLGQCYAITGDARYAEEFVAQLGHWWADNPAEFGPNWANAMEVAIRAANLIWGYELMRSAPSIDDEFTIRFLKSLIQHGQYIRRYLESGWPGSNHYIADLCGLAWLGLYLSPAQEAREWLQHGLRLLTREIQSQVHPDGTDYESSTSYHLLVTEMLLWTVAYCQLNEVELPSTVHAKVAAMLDVVVGLLRPDGNLPLFGDCDSGRWLALESDTPTLLTGQDPRGVLALGAILFENRYWAIAAGADPVRWEAASWAFGARAREARDAAASNLQSKIRNLQFPDAGWYVLRHGDQHLAVSAGNVGAGGWGTHDHNDALSFEFAIGDRLFLVDPGSFVYTGDHRARNAFRATAAHNTVRVDGREQNRIPARDMFRLENDVRATVLDWRATDEQAWLEAEYITRAGRWWHHRRFEYRQDPGCWLITDKIKAGAWYALQNTHSIELVFHFSTLPVELDGLTVWTTCETGPNLVLLPLGAARCALFAALEADWHAPHYGVRWPAWVVRYQLAQIGFGEFQFALVPFAGPAQPRYAREVLRGMVESP